LPLTALRCVSLIADVIAQVERAQFLAQTERRIIEGASSEWNGTLGRYDNVKFVQSLLPDVDYSQFELRLLAKDLPLHEHYASPIERTRQEAVLRITPTIGGKMQPQVLEKYAELDAYSAFKVWQHQLLQEKHAFCALLRQKEEPMYRLPNLRPVPNVDRFVHNYEALRPR